MSKYIIVGEHHIAIPDLPTGRSEILFVDEKKEDAFWNRSKLIKEYRDIFFEFIPYFTKVNQEATLYNNEGLLQSLSVEDTSYIVRIYEQEISRRINGVWFKNKEEYTWITGSHYFFLMWSRMARLDGLGSYADYREFQRDYFYLIHHVRSNPLIKGLFFSKPKKTGITNAHWSGYYLNKATMEKKKNLGYMNIDIGQSIKTMKDYFLYALDGLPSPMKPNIKSIAVAEGRIEFGEAITNSRKIKKPLREEDRNSLDNAVYCVATAPHAFDIAVMSDVTFDEPTKFKTSFEQIWTDNKSSIMFPGNVQAKAWLFNYTAAEDSNSFREAREIFRDCELSTMGTNGQTKSKMINWHIPAYASWNTAFDKWGKCNEKRAYEEIMQGRAELRGDKRKLQAFTREYANTKEEAWESMGAGSMFDNMLLSSLKSELEESLRYERPYTEGHYEWENPLWEMGSKNLRPKGIYGPVKFVPLSEHDILSQKEDRVHKFQDVPATYRNIGVRNGKDREGNLMAPERFLHVGGVDPTDYAAKAEILKGSKQGGYLMNLPDLTLNNRMGKIATKIILDEYFARPDKPDEMFEDVAKQIVYSGMAVVVEANKKWLATRLIEEGLGRFVIVRNNWTGRYETWKPWVKHPKTGKWERMDYSLINNDKDMLETLVRLIFNHITPPKPDQGGIDYGKTIQTVRLIEQLMDVSFERRELYDLFNAFGFTLFGMEVLLDQPPVEQNAYDPQMVQAVASALGIEL